MTRYSVQPRDRIFVKAYGFLSFTKNMGTIIGKSISENLSGKYSQKLPDHAKPSATDAFKTASKRPIQEAAEGTSDLIGNKIADRIIKVSKSSKAAINEHDKEIHKERYTSPAKKQEIIDDLRLK